jgi:hypothetical protein
MRRSEEPIRWRGEVGTGISVTAARRCHRSHPRCVGGRTVTRQYMQRGAKTVMRTETEAHRLDTNSVEAVGGIYENRTIYLQRSDPAKFHGYHFREYMESMKENTTSQQLDTLKEDFYRFHTYIIEEEGDSAIMESIRTLVDAAYTAHNLKALKRILREVKVMMREILPALSADGQRLVRELLAQESIEREATIRKIIRRGKISGEQEYRLLLGRVEEIYSDDKKSDEVRILNGLLGQYEGGAAELS